MKKRGLTYWRWADPRLVTITHSEVVGQDWTIEVQARLSCTGATQLFLGLYDNSGTLLLEEAYEKRPGQTVTTALHWGIERLRSIALAKILTTMGLETPAIGGHQSERTVSNQSPSKQE